MKSIIILISLLYLQFSAVYAISQAGSVYFDLKTQRYSFVSTFDTNAVAFGSFVDTLNQTGWGVLKVETNSKFEDAQQLFAAGFLEGALTADRIYQNFQNSYDVFFDKSNPPSRALLDFLKRQDEWTMAHVAGPYQYLTDYWKGVALITSQFSGLMQGYQSVAPKNQQLDEFAFQMLNGVGDFLDLIPALNEEKRIDWDSLTPQEIAMEMGRSGHCSALIKLTGDMNELFAGHSSWFTYGAMNRIFKHYNFNLNGKFVAAKKMSFSSYPGFLVSLDDFYMMDSGLAMVQTTNSILDAELYKKVTADSLFAWQRVRLANLLAHTGKEWAELFGVHNTGTYNNQYMVVDYKQFQVGTQIGEGTLWVVEQIPGLVESADTTSQLERGYWASYNVPYFPRIYNESGYPAFVEKHGVDFSYQMAPRAQIFRRDQGTVTNLDTFKNILRYNDYLHDPVSKGDPGKAICSRFDLVGSPSGCYDTKVTNQNLFPFLVSHAINGPTTSHHIPPFQWTAQFNGTLHEGMPKLFNFKFEVMDPKW